jgi:hypothetical protein
LDLPTDSPILEQHRDRRQGYQTIREEYATVKEKAASFGGTQSCTFSTMDLSKAGVDIDNLHYLILEYRYSATLANGIEYVVVAKRTDTFADVGTAWLRMLRGSTNATALTFQPFLCESVTTTIPVSWTQPLISSAVDAVDGRRLFHIVRE